MTKTFWTERQIVSPQ